MTVVDQQRFVSQTVWDKNHDEETISAADLFRMRLDFAARGLANVQELIRFMDQKSGLVISAVGILTTAQGAFMLRALSSTPQTLLEITLPMLIITCALTYTLVAFSVVFAGMKVFTPSVAPRCITIAGLFVSTGSAGKERWQRRHLPSKNGGIAAKRLTAGLCQPDD